jgi:hypothetical protein
LKVPPEKSAVCISTVLEGLVLVLPGAGFFLYSKGGEVVYSHPVNRLGDTSINLVSELSISRW